MFIFIHLASFIIKHDNPRWKCKPVFQINDKKVGISSSIYTKSVYFYQGYITYAYNFNTGKDYHTLYLIVYVNNQAHIYDYEIKDNLTKFKSHTFFQI